MLVSCTKIVSKVFSVRRPIKILVVAHAVEYVIQVLVSDTKYTDVTQAVRRQMSIYTSMSRPVLVHTYLERPCVSVVTGQYLYVMMVLTAGTTTTMGILDLRVYSGRYLITIEIHLQHWKLGLVMLLGLLAMVAPHIVVMTTSAATSDDKTIIKTNLGFSEFHKFVHVFAQLKFSYKLSILL